MTVGKHFAPLLALMLCACAHPPAPAVAVAAATSAVTAAPAPLTSPAPEIVLDAVAVATAQRNLRALGYNVGKSADAGDPAFQRAILAFEKDHGLSEDGILSAAIMDRLKLMRGALAKPAPVETGRGEIFVYSDGSNRKSAPGLVMPLPGLVSDAPANFMLPLRPASQASFQLGIRAKDSSFKAAMVVTCKAGRLVQTSLPLGPFDTIAVDCLGEGAKPVQWRSLYSPALGAVVRQETSAGVHDLVALRPATAGWPSAARLGLEWAITHALVASGTAPVPWSSTAIARHFEIRSAARQSGQEAGLGGKYAALLCRRFDVVQLDQPASHYPGIACQTAPGVWSLPGSATSFATPANDLTAQN